MIPKSRKRWPSRKDLTRSGPEGSHCSPSDCSAFVDLSASPVLAALPLSASNQVVLVVTGEVDPVGGLKRSVSLHAKDGTSPMS